MTGQMLFNAVCVTIQFVCLAVNARLFHLNTQRYTRWHSRTFLRLRRVNIALMVYAVALIVVGVVLIAGEAGR